jgi:hypothetical protein
VRFGDRNVLTLFSISSILLFRAFDDAYLLLSNSGTISRAPEHIPALDADLFKNFMVTIMQLIKLISALEVLAETSRRDTRQSIHNLWDTLAIFKKSDVTRKADLDDDNDVILNVPGWRQRRESRPTLPFTTVAAPAPVLEDATVDNMLRLLLVTRNEELEGELRGLRFLLWRMSPTARAKLGNIVKVTLPLHHEELMRSPVEDFVVHWQAAVVAPGQGMDNRIMENGDTDSW